MTWRGAIELSKGIGLSVAAVAGVTGAIYALRPAAPVLSLGVLYVIAVVTVAVFRGLAYAIPVCVASLLTFNFLFLPPVHTFALRDSANWVALAAYLVTAVVVSELATRSRRLAREAVEAETLRQSDAVKTAVLRAVSHDLRSPLTAIRAASDGLENPALTLDSSDREALWETIRIEVHRLERLVENLLDLSRLDAGPAVRRPEVWTVDIVLARALEQLGVEADRVTVSLEEPAPLPIRVDAAQIERVLVNLLENALKFSSPTDPVSVSASSGAGRVLIRVRDRGPGIVAGRPRADLRAVRAGKRGGSRQRPRSGDRARLRGGKRRRHPCGVVERTRRLDLRAGSAGRCRARCRREMSDVRILVVDDEPQILRALRTSLQGAGYEVEAVSTAAAALAAAAMRPPNGVILDLVLPDGSGTDVCRELRGWLDAPILVLSAVGDEQEKVAALDAGADDYITKPFGIDELLARLRASLRRADAPAEPVVDLGGLVVDLERRSVTVDGAPVSLTPTEFDLLRLFARNEGKLLTHPTILRAVWGPNYGAESHYLHVYVSQLRRKIEQDPTRPRYLLTEPGAGYRLVRAS